MRLSMRLPVCKMLALFIITTVISACQPSNDKRVTSKDAASSTTKAQQKNVLALVDVDDKTDFSQANKGLIAQANDLQIRNADIINAVETRDIKP